MPYYQGDYYRGDYYRGDPGFLGGLFRGVARVARGVAGALVPAPVRTALAVVSGARAATGVMQAPIAPPTGIGLPGPFRMHPGAFLPGGKPFITRQTAPGGGCPPGWHLNKGGRSPGTYCVRNRRMNPTNARALRRAVRREQAFVAVARRVLRGTGLRISRGGMARKKTVRRR